MRTLAFAAKLTILTMVSVYAIATPAAAQTCAGRESFTDAPWQARAATSYSNGTKTYGPSITRGSSTVFVGAAADVVGYPGLDQTALALSGTIGVEHTVGGRASRVYGCPVLVVLHQFGPNVPTANFSSNVASLGGRVGIVASENATVQVVPTFGVDVEYEGDTGNPTDPSVASVSSSKTFAVTRLGVGFVLNHRTAIVPEIVQIYGAASDTTLRVTVAFGFGKQ